MTQQKKMLMLTVISVILFTGCDPYYAINVINRTRDTTRILVKANMHFSTEKLKTGVTPDGFDIYELVPEERIRVGSAIAEIDNDLPFDTLKIVRNADTLTARGTKEIKALFDKKKPGGLKKPYNISIK